MTQVPTPKEQREAIELLLEYANYRLQKLKAPKPDRPFKEQYSEKELLAAAKQYLQRFVKDVKESNKALADEEN